MCIFSISIRRVWPQFVFNSPWLREVSNAKYKYKLPPACSLTRIHRIIQLWTMVQHTTRLDSSNIWIIWCLIFLEHVRGHDHVRHIVLLWLWFMYIKCNPESRDRSRPLCTYTYTYALILVLASRGRLDRCDTLLCATKMQSQIVMVSMTWCRTFKFRNTNK